MDRHSQPKVGYGTSEKQEYRRQVWELLIPAWEEAKGHPDAHVVLMPSGECFEIEHVLALGVPEDRIVAVDRSAAVIATSKWRKKYPRVKFFACQVGDLHARLEKIGAVVAAANLDFCSNFSDDLVGQFQSFCEYATRFDSARIAVTVAKGREGRALNVMLDRFAPEVDVFNEKRLAALVACALWRGEKKSYVLWGEGAYVTNKMPMAWCVFSEFYEYNRLLKGHIASLQSARENAEGLAAEVRSEVRECLAKRSRRFAVASCDVQHFMKKRDAEDFLIRKYAIPFMNDVESMKKSNVLFGAPCNPGVSKYSDVVVEAQNLVSAVWSEC